MRFENTDIWGFEHALHGMRNPMNSWEKSDSKLNNYYDLVRGDVTINELIKVYPNAHIHHSNTNGYYVDIIGKDDMKLAQTLLLSGNEHSKFMRMIHVSVDTDMPRYWWSEADTYHFNTKNSCSTMHKLLNRNTPITLDMFVICQEDMDWWNDTINKLELMRQKYKEIQATTKNSNDMNRLLVRAKRMLPEGFLQMRTWDTNYAELRNMYFQRRYHRLKEEWIDAFCKWVESLPYAEELIMYEGEKK